MESGQQPLLESSSREASEGGPSCPQPEAELLALEDLASPRALALEARRLLALSWPVIAEELLTYGSTIVALEFVGRLDAWLPPLAVYSLARSVLNITGLSLLVGVTGGVDTCASQAHGAGARALVGVSLQRAVLVSLLACLPVLALYLRAGLLLRWLGEEEQVAAAAGRYVLLASPFLFLHAVILCVYRYLIAQGEGGTVLSPLHSFGVSPPGKVLGTPTRVSSVARAGAVLEVMVSGAVFFAATAPINWLLVNRLQLGLDGSALAIVACDAVYLAAVVSAAAVHNARLPPARRPWRGLSRRALRGWGSYLGLTLASLAMVASDWWVMDISTLLAVSRMCRSIAGCSRQLCGVSATPAAPLQGRLPDADTQLAAIGITYNLNAILFTVPFGLSFAAGAQVGQLLGAQRPAAARHAVVVGTALGMAMMAALAVALGAARRQTIALLTPDAEMQEATRALMPPMLLALVGNGGNAVLAGVLRGCGRQRIGAAANFVANWAVGLPLEIWLAFRLGLGAWGLWVGLCAAAYV